MINNKASQARYNRIYHQLKAGERPSNKDLVFYNTFKTALKRSVKRKVDLDLGVEPPKSQVFKNKKKYNRTKKHKAEHKT